MAYTPSNDGSYITCTTIYLKWYIGDLGDSVEVQQLDTQDNSWITIATLPASAIIWTGNTIYYDYSNTYFCLGGYVTYKVINHVGATDYEREISIFFPNLPDTSDLTLVSHSGTTATFTWNLNRGIAEKCDNRVDNIQLQLFSVPYTLPPIQWNYISDNRIPSLTTTGITVTGLTAGITYRAIIKQENFDCYSSIYTKSNYVYIYALNAGTIASGQTICYLGNPAAFTSTADASGGVTGYTYQWQYSTDSGSTWNDLSGANGTTYDSGTLTATRWFRRRVIDSDSPASTGYSNTLQVTVYPALYAGEIAANQTICSGTAPALLTSTAAASGASGSYVYQWQYSTNGVSYSNIAGATSTTYQPPALTETTYYKRRVYDTFCGIGGAEYSNVVLITVQPPPPTDLPTPFCDGSHWTASGSTCGNSDGYITIIDNIPPIFSYFDIYDFTLTDVTGGTYTFNTTTGEATGLTSGYYFLSATVKPEYWYYYGRDNCQFDWIKIEDTDNPAFLVGVSVKPQQCGPFDRQFGRIFYNVSGLTSGNTYSFYAFRSDLSLYYSKTGITSTEDFILANASAECYWVLIRDEVTGCALLLDNRCVPSVPFFSLGGIKKLYLAKWSDDVDVDFWKDSDEDYFLEFTDTSFFNSTKVKQYKSLTGGTIQWYSIPVLPKVCKLSQTLGKVRQGYIFTTSLTIGVAKANASKWKEMSTILNPENKWIFIVQDADNFWWTGGAQFGARISMYQFKTGARGEDEGYTFEIQGIENNKILTSIDTDYVNTYVI